MMPLIASVSSLQGWTSWPSSGSAVGDKEGATEDSFFAAVHTSSCAATGKRIDVIAHQFQKGGCRSASLLLVDLGPKECDCQDANGCVSFGRQLVST